MYTIQDVKDALHRKDYEKGLAICKSLLFDKKDDYAILGYYGALLLKLERYVDAIEVFDNLLLRQDDGLMFELRGDSYYGLKKNKLAIRDYMRVLKVEKNLDGIYDKIARAYYRIGKKDLAYLYIDKAIEYNKIGSFSLKNKAIFLRFDGRTAESFELLAALRKLDPADEFIRNEQWEIIQEAFSEIIPLRSPK